MPPLLSILTPAIWPRIQQAMALSETIEHQIRTCGVQRQVEHLILLDNCTRSVGLKRQALLDIARGDYVIYCDDDDTVSTDYVSSILQGARTGVDVVTFVQRSEINGVIGWIKFDANAETDAPFTEGQIVSRPPWHVCAWRRQLVKECVFTDKNDGEDYDWILQARQHAHTCAHIDKILHTYRFNSSTTAATGK